MVYFYILLVFDQEDATLCQHQLRAWWFVGGRIIFFTITFSLVWSSYTYINGLQMLQWALADHHYGKGGTSFHYGVFQVYWGIRMAFILLIIITHFLMIPTLLRRVRLSERHRTISMKECELASTPAPSRVPANATPNRA